MPKVISRQEAKAIGAVRYFTGKACKHGHVSERRTDNGQCVECREIQRIDNREKINAEGRKRYSENKELYARKAKEYRENNKEKIRKHKSKYYFDNKEEISNKKKEKYELNKTQILKTTSEYKRKNKHKVANWNAERKARKKKAIPKWLSDDAKWMIREIYELRETRERLTGVKWHVDHIIPINGKIVCGLHVPENLQVITATENVRKSNSYEA